MPPSDIARRLRRSCVHVALAFTLACAARAEDLPERPVFLQYGVEQGLPSSRIHQVAQDRAGYLWIATIDGLSRYDGVDFTTFRRGSDGGAEVPGTSIETVLVDAADRIWIGVEGGGVSVIDADRRELRRVGTDGSVGTEPQSLLDVDVWALAEDRDGGIWIGGYDFGIHRIDPDTLIARGIRDDRDDADPQTRNPVLCMTGTPDGWIWAGTSAGLDVIDARGAGDEPLSVAHHLLPGELVTALALQPDGSMLVGGRGKLWRVPRDLGGPGEPELLPVPELAGSNAAAHSLVRDAGGTVWIATRQHGLFRMGVDGRVRAIAAQPGWPLALPTRELLHGLRDREDNLWFATYGSGLLQIRAGSRNFALLRDEAEDARPAEAGSWIGASRCPDGDIWLLRRKGPLLRFDRQGDRTVVERDERSGFSAWPGRIFTSLACDRDGVLWLGTREGVLHFDPATSELRAWLPRRGYAPLPGSVHLIWPDIDGAVWTAAQGSGVTRFDPGGVSPRKYAGGNDGLRIVDIEQMGRAPDGSLWIAGDGGIDRLEPTASAFEAIKGVPRGTIHAFAFASDGSVWLHSHAGLLHARVDGATLIPITLYGPAQGLERMEIGALVNDPDDFVWLIGGRALRRLDPRTGTWRTYGAGDGLPVTEFTTRPVEVHADGSVLALSTLGAIQFHPQRIVDSRIAPHFLVESIRVQRQGERLALPVAAPFRLRHDDRDLTIRTRALSLVDPASNRYRFRLDPFDSRWQEGDADGTRVYSSLEPGTYVLTAQGASQIGAWSQPVRLHFTVDQPPWLSPAAWVAYALVLLGAIALLALQQRLRWQRRHELALIEAHRELAERANRAKSDFLADVAHEIRTPISGMSGMSDLLARTTLDTQQARYVARMRGAIDMLLKLINNLLDLARIESGHLELAEVPTDLIALLEELIELETPAASSKGVSLTLECDPGLPAWIAVDPLRLRQILFNLVGNALKFIEHGGVRLRADAPSAGWIRLRVSDTGPGLSVEAQGRLFRRFEQGDDSVSRRHGGSGLGLAIVRQLVELMQGRMSVESEPGKGSTFGVELPLQQVAPETNPPPHGSGSSQPATLAELEQGTGLRMLLVEDDPTVSEALAALMQRDGFTVLVAVHGLAAMAELDRSRFDVALVDFDLPGLSGLELARMLRGRGSKLPLIGISARADSGAESDAQAAGMNLFLRKPIDPQVLRESIAMLLAGR